MSCVRNYFKNKSNLLDVLTTVIGDNANILFDSNEYDNKKMKILGYGETFNDKVKLNYSIKLTPEAINPQNPASVDTDTIEMLEDLLTQALSDATKKATSQMEAKMKSITGGISIPGLF